jgi:vacuolar-type H+-ATPase subunit I/STV1
MNTITKIFIVLNMLVAVVAGGALAVYYATSENYKRRWDRDTTELATDLKRLSDRLLEQSFLATDYRDKFNAQSQKTEDLQAKLTEMENEKKVLEARISSLQTEKSEQAVIIKSQQDRIDKLDEQLRVANKRKDELNHIATVARAVAFQLNVKLAEVEDDYNNAQAELTRRERTIYEHEEELKKQAAFIALIRRDFPDAFRIATSQVPPDAQQVNAVVAAVHPNPQGQQDLVALTVGRDDSVREGQEFSVYRQGNYIVRIRIEQVKPDMCFGRVLPDTWNAKELKIQPGDMATNKLF